MTITKALCPDIYIPNYLLLFSSPYVDRRCHRIDPMTSSTCALCQLINSISASMKMYPNLAVCLRLLHIAMAVDWMLLLYICIINYDYHYILSASCTATREARREKNVHGESSLLLFAIYHLPFADFFSFFLLPVTLAFENFYSFWRHEKIDTVSLTLIFKWARNRCELRRTRREEEKKEEGKRAWAALQMLDNGEK